MASFLTGIGGPGTWGEYEVPQFISSQNFQFAGFVQDNWKATDKLTLTLGLRYDLDLPRTERFNAMSYLDPDVASPLQVPGFSNLKGGLRFVDSNDRHNYGADIGGHWHPIFNIIAGGWKTNGIWRFSAGQPLGLGLSGGTPLPTYGDQRPNLTGTLLKTSNADFLTQYFANPGVAVKPERWTLGTAPRVVGTVRTPGINNANMSLFKEFPVSAIREGMRLELRAEFFNAFNHPTFCGPDTTVEGGSFGQVQSTCGPPREVQMALKFYW